MSVYRQEHAPRHVADAWLPCYVDSSDGPIWRREIVQISDGAWSGETVQMKVCICPLSASSERVPIRFTSAEPGEQAAD